MSPKVNAPFRFEYYTVGNRTGICSGVHYTFIWQLLPFMDLSKIGFDFLEQDEAFGWRHRAQMLLNYFHLCNLDSCNDAY